MLPAKLRTILALALVIALAVVDSVSWILSFCADLVIAALLYIVLVFGRDPKNP